MNEMKPIIAFVLIFGLACWQQQNEKGTLPEPTEAKTVRYGMITGVKPEKMAYYKALHAKPWPKVLAKIKACNIRNYSIYLQKVDQRYFLFSYFEYTGRNFEEDMKKMAADTTTQRWWKETDPCQLPLAEALAKHQIWTGMEEVFHTD